MSIDSKTVWADTGKGFFRSRGLCLATAAVIVALLFYLGAQPFAARLLVAPWDKLAHFLVFGTITGLLWVGTAGRMPWLLIGIVAAIGTLDEWHQAGLPGRTMDMKDLATDIAAAIFTIVALQVCNNKPG